MKYELSNEYMSTLGPHELHMDSLVQETVINRMTVNGHWNKSVSEYNYSTVVGTECHEARWPSFEHELQGSDSVLPRGMARLDHRRVRAGG